jgi:hypothetical protein
VDELTPQELATRKLGLAMRTVKEPEKLQSAVGGLWSAYLALTLTLTLTLTLSPTRTPTPTPTPTLTPTLRRSAYLAVLATLRLEFARVAALALGIAEMLKMRMLK